MNRYLIAGIFGVLAFAAPVISFAAMGNVYFAETSAGTGTGVDCADAMPFTFLRVYGNWGNGASQVGPGTTVHLCGTIDPGAGNALFVVYAGGTSSNPITVKFEPGAVVQSAYFGPYLINFHGFGWITVDGGPPNSGPGASASDAVIQATGNGTGLQNHTSTDVFYADGTSNVTIKNLTIKNLYLRLPPVALSNVFANGDATATATCAGPCNLTTGLTVNVYGTSNASLNTTFTTILRTPTPTTFIYKLPAAATGAGTGGAVDDVTFRTNWGEAVRCLGCSNLTIDHLTVHDTTWAFVFNVSNSTLSNSDIYNMSHGIAMGCFSGSTCSNFQIFGNHFHDMGLWNDPSPANTYHFDYIHSWGHQAGAWGTIVGTEIYDNIFDGDQGQNLTSFIFYEDSNQSSSIYNNVFSELPNRGADSNGLLGLQSRTGDLIPSKNNAVYNNTFIGGRELPHNNTCLAVVNETGVTVENNVFVGCTTEIAFYNSTIALVDNNVYEDTATSLGSNSPFSWNNNKYSTTLSAASALCNCDQHSVFTTLGAVNISPTGIPQSGSVAIGAGMNLSSLGLPALTYDLAGVLRSPTGVWDAGAYAYTGTLPSPPPPTPPTPTSTPTSIPPMPTSTPVITSAPPPVSPPLPAVSGGGGGGGGGGSGSYYYPPVGQSTTSQNSGSASSGSPAAIIQSLLVQLQTLIAELNAQLIGTFTRDLTFGSFGDDVKNLQMFLNDNGYTVAQSGPGSPGNEVMRFGRRTAAALRSFQQANYLPATGYFGARTRAFLGSKW